MRRRTVGGAALGLALLAAACQPADPFTHASSMHVARAGHTATLLTSGRVLVTGGAAAGQPSVEVYDPGAGTWAVRAGMLTPRSGHLGTRLGTGKVLVTGGRSTATGNLLTTAEVYDPAADRWTRAAGTPYPGGHSAALLPDGKVLAVFADDRGRGWLYDPVADAWQPTATKQTAAWRTTTALPGGKALVVGGDTIKATDTTEGSSRAERFDPATGLWSLTSTVPGLLPRQAVALGGAVVAIGPSLLRRGSYAETAIRVARFDPGPGTWQGSPEAAGCENFLSAGMTLTGLEDGSWFVAGRGECAGTTYPIARHLRFGQDDAEYLEGFAERERHAAVLLPDGRVLITGGAFALADGSCCPPLEVRATVELFTP